MPRPVTSPTTIPRRPPGIANASYQSPPTWAPSPATSYDAAKSMPLDLGKALRDQAALKLDRDPVLLLVQLGLPDAPAPRGRPHPGAAIARWD